MTTTPIFIHVDPGSSTPIYQQLVEAVTRAIAAGALAAGDPLPSVRELAVELRINLNTVSRAYRRLGELGRVEVRRGRGVFVAAGTAAAGPSDRLALLDPTLSSVVREARELDLQPDVVAGRLKERFDDRTDQEAGR